MNIAFTCPGCGSANRREVSPGESIACQNCRRRWAAEGVSEPSGQVAACVICGCPHLYARKDFPARLGLTIVGIGFAVSCVTWNLYLPITTFVVLFAFGLLDMVVYFLVGEVLVCYRCQAHYRGTAARDQHAAFDLEVSERYRQEQQRLRSSDERSTRRS